MRFRRKAYAELVEWKQHSHGRTAFLIEGAKHVGKTTIAREFAENEYRSYILIDFSTASDDTRQLFTDHIENPKHIFTQLSLEYGVKLYLRDTLFIFDEVQFCPAARQGIKQLVADGQFDYLETGSLITVNATKAKILIPSEEEGINMYPMDFEEYCWARGEEPLIEHIKECWNKKIPLSNSLHRKAMGLFREYMLVGGMPQAVEGFINNTIDFTDTDQAKKTILSLYHNDLEKAPSPSKAKAVFDNIPSFLSRHDKKIVFSNLQQKANSDDYQETFSWLGDSRMVNLCWKSTDPNVGLALSKEDASVKCYMGDTGLLMAETFRDTEWFENDLYLQILKDKLSINEGMIYENAIAQMLVASGRNLFFYTRYNSETHHNEIEIDFITSGKGKSRYKLIPIEMKSTEKYSYTSLKRFRKAYSQKIELALIVHPGNLKITRDTETGYEYTAIPPYMVPFI